MKPVVAPWNATNSVFLATRANLKVGILRWLVVTQLALAGFIFATIKFVK